MSCSHFILYNKWIDCCECSICGSKYKCDNCLIISNKNLYDNLDYSIVKCYECNKSILVRLCNICKNIYCIGCQ